MTFEEEYADILQNLEFGIVRIYQEHPEMSDYNAMDAIEGLIRKYIAEERKTEPRPIRFTELAEKVFDSVETMCELRLGRATVTDAETGKKMAGLPPITTNELILCLKRIKKSISFWNKQGGRQGYLNYVSNFIR
jgi:hypothetical protein